MLYLKRTLRDGSVAVEDSDDGATFILEQGQWIAVLAQPVDRQRAAVQLFAISNRADPAGGRSHTGEAHQDQERG